MTAQHWYGDVGPARVADARRYANRLQTPQMVHAHSRDEWHADGSDLLVGCTAECVGLLPAPTLALNRVDGPPATRAELAAPHLNVLRRLVGG